MIHSIHWYVKKKRTKKKKCYLLLYVEVSRKCVMRGWWNYCKRYYTNTVAQSNYCKRYDTNTVAQSNQRSIIKHNPDPAVFPPLSSTRHCMRQNTFLTEKASSFKTELIPQLWHDTNSTQCDRKVCHSFLISLFFWIDISAPTTPPTLLYIRKNRCLRQTLKAHTSVFVYFIAVCSRSARTPHLHPSHQGKT